MSGFSDLHLYNAIYERAVNGSVLCPDFQVTPLSGFIVYFNSFPVLLTLVTASMALYKIDVFLYMLTFIGLTVNSGINYLLRNIFQHPAKYAGCGEQFNMPDFGAQHAIFFSACLLLFAVTFNYRVSIYSMFCIVFFFGFAMYTRLYIGVTTISQFVVGAIFGLAWACLYIHILVRYKRHIDRFLESAVARWMQIDRGIFAEPVYDD